MSKVILSTLAAAFVCIVATSAFAADGAINTATMNDMGLSGMQVMTDTEALDIRGLGFRRHFDLKPSKPWASAEGKSWARIGDHHDSAAAGTTNEYAAEGKYEASGANESVASLEKVDILRVDYSDGTFSIETKTHQVTVGAGGSSSAKAF